jgi:hypothetical protein
MERLAIQVIAEDYASHGLGVFPALPRSKEPAGSWKAYQWQPPSDIEREALFSLPYELNIGVICGAASNNLAGIDCETTRAFEETLRHVDRVGYSETWTVSTKRGGHVYLFLPVAVKPIAKCENVEVRAQGQFMLLPPSQHPSGPFYRFVNRPPEIATVRSLSDLDWLVFEEAGNGPGLPRKAKLLLQGSFAERYNSRSEAEQAIVTVLVNASFPFEQILRLFSKYPAAGKFSEIQSRHGKARAVDWLRRCFEAARLFCATESPGRILARRALSQAIESPWPRRTGSSDRAVYCAHTTLAYRSGCDTYHASSRDLAEIAGCSRRTASVATGRLRAQQRLELTTFFNATYANRYRLSIVKSKVSENVPLPTTQCEGVGQTSSFVLPDAFRSGGLGKPAYEVLIALEHGSSSVSDLALKTGRHIQTVRTALKRMLPLSLVEKRGRTWQRGPNENLEAVAEALGVNGSLMRQKERHQKERIRRNVSHAIIRQRKDQGMI